MSKIPGDSFGFQFYTFAMTSPFALANADSLPTGKMVHNGGDDSTNAVTVTNLGTGIYKATGAIPGTYVSGDDFQVRINATISAALYAYCKDYGPLDGERVSDVAATLAVYAGTGYIGHVTAVGSVATFTVTLTGLPNLTASNLVGLTCQFTSGANAMVTADIANASGSAGVYVLTFSAPNIFPNTPSTAAGGDAVVIYPGR